MSTPHPDSARPSTSASPAEDTRASQRRQILIAEDSKSDIFLIRQALKQSGIDAQIHIANDGEETIKYVERVDADATAPCPDLILLDINMPRYKGGEILRRLRDSARCAHALVLIVTSSDLLRDREEMTALGANGYFRKPSDFAEFMKLGDIVRELLSKNE